MRPVERFFHLGEDTYPAHNMYNDFLSRKGQVPKDQIAVGNIGAIFDNIYNCEGSIGSSPVVASLPNAHPHWWTGGFFSLPWAGTEAIMQANYSKGAVTSYISPSDAKTYYRLFYTDEPIKKDISKDEPKSFTDRAGGAPLDTIMGDHGYCSEHGYSYGVLSGGPAFMKANPLSSIEFYDLDSSIKMSSYNFTHYTGQGTRQSFTNVVKELSDDRNYGSIKGGKDDPFEEYNYFTHMGSIGNYFTLHARNPDKSGVHHCNLHDDGEFFTKTRAGIILGVGKLEKITGIKKRFDPSQESSEDEDDKTPEDFNWLPSGRIAQQAHFLKDQTKYYETFVLEQEQATPTTPAPVTTTGGLADIGPTSTTSQASPNDVNLDDGFIHIRDDGSIMLMSKGGASIELSTDGRVVISSKQDTLIQPGTDLNILTGGETRCVTKNNITLRSTDKSLQLFAKEKLQAYTEEDQILIETDSDRGIVNKCKEGSFHLQAKNEFHQVEDFIARESSRETIKTTDFNIQARTSIFDIQNWFINNLSCQHLVRRDWNVSSASWTWKGRSLQYNASGFAKIRCSTPVLINHNHVEFRRGDVFRPRKISGPDTRLTFIQSAKPAVSIPTPTVPAPGPIPFPEESTIEVQEEKSNAAYHFIPWQYLQNTPWPNLTTKVKDQEVFPNNDTLFSYDGSALKEIDWQQYPITAPGSSTDVSGAQDITGTGAQLDFT